TRAALEADDRLAVKRGPVAQGFNDVGADPLREERQDVVTDAVAQEAEIRIRRVLDPLEAARGQMGEDLGTAHVEEWPDEGAANGRDAGQSAWPRALEQAHQDRLRLIVGRVARRDAVGAERAGAGLEGRVANTPGLCLEALPG